jgi:uncharacterized membrane protein
LFGATKLIHAGFRKADDNISPCPMPGPDILSGVVPVFVIAAGLVLSGLVQIVVMSRASDGRLKRSKLVGIRTRATLASDEAWQSAHQAAKPLGLRAGIAFLASGLVIPVARVGLFLALAGLAFGIVCLYLSTRAGVRAVTEIATKKSRTKDVR